MCTKPYKINIWKKICQIILSAVEAYNIKCTLRCKFIQYLHIINYCRSISSRTDYNHRMVYFAQSCRIRTNSSKYDIDIKGLFDLKYLEENLPNNIKCC